MMSCYRFIGGPAHGEWMEASGHRIIHMRQPTEFVYLRPEKPLERITPEEIHTYRLLTLGHQDIYIEDHCSDSEGEYLFDLFRRSIP